MYNSNIIVPLLVATEIRGTTSGSGPGECDVLYYIQTRPNRWRRSTRKIDTFIYIYLRSFVIPDYSVLDLIHKLFQPDDSADSNCVIFEEHNIEENTETHILRNVSNLLIL